MTDMTFREAYEFMSARVPSRRVGNKIFVEELPSMRQLSEAHQKLEPTLSKIKAQPFFGGRHA